MTTEKKIQTRFPPEPNGYIHLGHLKAMNVDFGYHENTSCILRLDDTNPDVETEEFVNSIIENVNWLGYKPSKITFTSDYFDELLNNAKKLIELGLAYVDHQTFDEIKKQRFASIESKYRNINPEQNMEQFEAMISGKLKTAVLRLKIDMSNTNPNMRDPVAYRFKESLHYRTKNKFCIYPSYDFSHSIVDSLEKITHSYCTIEFESRRPVYYWTLDALNMYKPIVYEFARLNIKNSLLSKRKIKELIDNKSLFGYDDPRLLTIDGLRRAGYSAKMLRDFITSIGNPMLKYDAIHDISLLHDVAKKELDSTAIRCFAVTQPLKIIIDNLDKPIKITRNNHPKLDIGTHECLLDKIIYIDENDFRKEDCKDYYGLAPNKIVRLKYSGFIMCTSYDEKEIHVKFVDPEIEKFNPKKIKGCLHWIAESNAIKSELWILNNLLEDDKYSEKSLIKYNGYIETYAEILKCDQYVQFERIGYFKFDKKYNAWLSIAYSK